jgi:5'-nucleotidase
LLLAAGCGSSSTPALSDGGEHSDGGVERRLVLFSTTDEHSHLFAFGPEVEDYPLKTAPGSGALVGGVARRAAILTTERAAAAAVGIDTLTVSAGDQTQGALPQVALATSAPDFTLMKTLGYDVMCPGNHEFELGPAKYAAAINAAIAHGGLPPIVSSNIRFSDTDAADDTLAALYGEGTSQKPIKRYHVLTTPSGIKVGFLGIMGGRAALYAPNKAPVRFSGAVEDEADNTKILPAIYADIRPVVAALRDTEQVDVVVALSHAGVNPDVPADTLTGEDYNIASNVEGIDAIISGHTHQLIQEPQVATAPDGHQVPIVQTGVFAAYLGRLELVLRPGQRPTFDAAQTRVIPIDDRTVPSVAAVNDALTQLVGELESTPLAGGSQSFLEAAITRIEGTAAAHDPAHPGSLYFRVLGGTTFDLLRHSSKESSAQNLSADAMLLAVEEAAGPVLVAVQGDGVVRADILAGANGDLSFADLFRVLPLGDSPFDGTLGYPLGRAYLMLLEIKAAFELSASVGLQDTGYFLSPAGVHVYYDTSRPPLDLSNVANVMDPAQGRVMKITADTDHSNGLDDEDVVLFDATRTGAEWDSALGGMFTKHPIATNLYIASFASAAGVTLKKANGDDLSLADFLLHRTDGSEIKDYEAFIGYIRELCQTNGGNLPARYDATAPQGTLPMRMFCTGPACP